MVFRMMVVLAMVLVSLWPAATKAQGPEQTVNWIYTSLTASGPVGLSYLGARERRAQFLSRRLVAFYEANETYGNDLAAACVDFAFDVPGQDYDAAEIARTLTLSTTGDATRQTVTARFSNFGQPALVVYDFIAEDGFWKIDDIAGPGWRVSLIPCAPRAASAAPAAPAATAPADGSAQYCYVRGDDTLRVDAAANGAARFEFFSVQANGHTCSARGKAQQVQGGWLFIDGTDANACRIGIMVTADGGLAISDPNWVCKPAYCGQRAVMDGLTFPPASRIDCARMPTR